MGCSCAGREKDPEEAPSKLNFEVAKTRRASLANVKGLKQPVTSLYRTISSQSTSKPSNMTLVEYQPTHQLCFLRSYSKPGLLVVEGFRQKFAEETEVLSKLNHPYVVRYWEALEDQRNVYLVTEAPSGGEVLSFLPSLASVSEPFAARLTFQVLLALSYAHSQGVPHLSLTLSHLFFKSRPKDDSSFHIQVTGFEDACSFSRTQDSLRFSPYRAPETYNGRSNDRSDVWSAGMILYHLMSGEFAISPAEYASVLTSPRLWTPPFSGDVWKKRPVPLKFLLSNMLSWNFTARPSAADCLRYGWFDNAVLPDLHSKAVKKRVSRLLATHSKCFLRNALKEYLISRTDVDVAEHTAVFVALDKGLQGFLTGDDLRHALQPHVGDAALEESKRLLALVDRQGRGRVEFSDFLVSVFSSKELLTQDKLLQVFRGLDREQRGRVSLDSLQYLLQLSPRKERDELWGVLLRLARKEAREELDFHEFCTVLRKAVGEEDCIGNAK